jgi:multidrug efflux pump subunit AcrB
MGYDFSGMAYQQVQAQGKSTPIFILALVFVYLVIAAQFESWLTPLSVLIAIPTGALGVYAALWIGGLDNSIYAQVGLVTMIGLTAKNAVLIVEFATQSRSRGKNPLEAGMEAAKLRFRPILMTSMAFMLGMVPLVLASGAESISRRTLGAAVLGGMLLTTLLTIFVTPIFWVAIETFASRHESRHNPHKDSTGHQDGNGGGDPRGSRSRAGQPGPAGAEA